ncbi:MAG TPA: hypothetical protein VFK81_21875 [Terriglobales bacterium]|jgi:uncharacterized protein (DUF1778 family)|nr:hypothetical protein [Terriglobales bacterium]
MAKPRTALLVRCSEEEAIAIRDAARRERRTISGFILNAVLNRIANQKRLEQEWQKVGGRKRLARAATESLE